MTKHLLAAVVLVLAAPVLGQGVTLHHVHGLAFSTDGRQLFIPIHTGLAVYEDGRWSAAPGPRHDYMGFVAAQDRFYSSGHPAPGSGLVNPFGLMRSRDGGRTWDKLGLQGESDFHVLAVGYRTNAIYVFNPAPNSRMKTPGIYSTRNDGLGWRPAAAKGLPGQVIALAAHPADPNTVAATTREGVFLSKDGGDTFARAASGEALAVHFDLDTKHLWFSGHDGTPRLYRVALDTQARTEISLPPLPRDAVAYIAQSPAAPGAYAIATFERSVFITADAGKTWRRIAERGRAQ